MENQYILDNLSEVLNRIRKACECCGRSPQEVRLLMATKTISPEIIKIAIAAGQQLIGENKVQEIRDKYQQLKDVPHEKHFIGYLQTNKINDVLKYGVSCIQSVDRWELAQKLHQKLLQAGREMEVYVEVNTSGEESKHGVAPTQAVALVQQLSQLNTLKVSGLMTIGKLTEDATQLRACFVLLRELKEEINSLKLSNVQIKELSMGMSTDLEEAIAQGATIVRVGSAIFGKRKYN